MKEKAVSLLIKCFKLHVASTIGICTVQQTLTHNISMGQADPEAVYNVCFISKTTVQEVTEIYLNGRRNQSCCLSE